MKKILVSCFIFLFVFCSAQIPTAGLLGYYPFNGNANDLSGNSQHGAVTGASLTLDRFGNSNSAYNFNGVSNYITLPAGTFTTLNLYTYSCWIKPTLASTGFAMCFGESSYGYCQALLIQPTGSITATSYNSAGNPIQSLIHSSTTYSLNQWIHIAMTRDYTSIKLYVNGVLFSSATASTNAQNASYGNNLPIRALIGTRSLFNSYFSGSIDDIRIYNNALTQNDILLLYNESCFQNITNSVFNSCSGNSSTITVSPTSSNTVNWYSTLTSTSSIGSGSVYTTPPLSAGVYTYYASASNCTLTNQRLPFIIAVNPSPTIAVSGGTICSGNSFTVSPSGANSYSYSNGNIVSPLVTTNYTVVGQDAVGCTSNTASLTVNVNASPSISVNSGFVCSGDSFTLSPTGATNFTFSGGSAIVSPTINTTYTITGTNGNGCYATAFSNVGVVATPSLLISNSGNVCIGSSLNLSVSGANYYTWSTSATTSSISVSPTVTTSYTVTGINLFGCISTSVTTVNVNPLPVISVNSGTVCQGNTFTILASGASTYTYSGSLNNIVSPLVNTNYSVTGTSAQGCLSSNIAISSVSVLALPAISANSGSICSGASFTIIPSGGINYTLSSGSAVVSPTTSTNYTITGNGANGCNNIAISSVSVIALPNVLINGTSMLCNGTTTILTASGASSYSWNTGSTSSSITITPSTTINYSVIGLNANGCNNSANHLVTVNPLPIVSVNSGSMCFGSSFTLNPSGAATYTISGGNSIVSPTSNATYSVIGTSALGCISSNTAIANVNVIAAPIITVNSGSICVGNSFTISPSGAISYTYSSGTPIVSPSSNTTYTIAGANASGCVSSASSAVTVNPLPILSIIGPTAICNGGSAILNATGANSYTWNTGSVALSITVSPTSTNSYSIIGSDLNGCKSSTTTLLAVNPLPTITINSGTICLGNSFTLSPNGASTYTYSSGTSVVTPTSNSSYTVNGTSFQGCSSFNSAVANVTVLSLPLVNVNSGTVCSGGTFIMNPTGAITYSYSNGSNTVIPIANSTYSVYGTNSQGCISAPAISNVTVISLPVVAVNSGSICTGGVFTLNPSGASNYTISGGLSLVSPSITSTYTVIGSNSLGCVGSAATSTVVVYALPVISVNSGAVCLGQIFTMIPSGASTYIYSNGSNTIIPTSNSSYTVTGTSMQGCASSNQAIANVTVLALPILGVNSGTLCSGSSFTLIPSGALTYTFSGGNAIVSPTTNATYSVLGTNSLGCISSVPAISNLIVIAIPNVSIAGNSTLCSGSTVNYTANGANTYTWSTGAQTQSIAITPTASTSYTVLGTNSSGCIGMAVQTISISSSPTITASNGIICQGNSFVISPSGANTYTISGGTATVSPSSNSIYTITGTSAVGCNALNPTTVAVSVNPLPTITIVGTSSICEGSSTNLIASGASIYTWNPGSATGTNITLSPTVSTNYTVSGVDLNGCENSNTFLLVVNPLPTISINSGAICPGNSFTLNPTGASSYTYSGGTSIVSPGTTSTYTVTGTDVNGCVSINQAIATVSVVNSLTVSVSGNTVICEGDTTNLTANGASTYSWSAGSFSNSISLSPSITTSYTLTGISGACSNDAVFSISVNPLPNVSINNASICVGASYTLTPIGALNYTYSSGLPIVSPLLNSSYTVTGIGANGCVSLPVSCTISVLPLPIISVNSSAPDNLCIGETATLTANGAVNYTWSPGLVNGNFLVVTPSVTSSYSVTGIDQNGCESTTIALQQVDVCTFINELKEKNPSVFQVYPNPSRGSFKIDYELNSAYSCKIKIEDLQGKTLIEQLLNVNEQTYNVENSTLKPGIYFISFFVNNKNISVKKIIITN